MGETRHTLFPLDFNRSIVIEDRPERLTADAGVPAKDVLRLLDGRTCDVCLNDAVYWRNIPGAVWEYHIGGYQVIKKWLSYREETLLGRPLTPEKAREVAGVVRRLTAILLLQPALDQNCARVKTATYDGPGGGEPI
ncbi:MAG: type ISP restriction/modification enzyme [Planctomycetota bacterium]